MMSSDLKHKIALPCFFVKVTVNKNTLYNKYFLLMAAYTGQAWQGRPAKAPDLQKQGKMQML